MSKYDDVIRSRICRITASLRKFLDAVKRTPLGEKLFDYLRWIRRVGLRAAAKEFLEHHSIRACYLPFREWPTLFKKALKSLKSNGLRATWKQISGYLKDRKRLAHPYMAEYPTIQVFLGACISNKGQLFRRDLLESASGNMVLLVSHELNLTGAPIALENLALCLKEMGKIPVMMAPRDDALRQRICDADIPVIILPKVYRSDIVLKAAHLFDYIVVCTNVGAPLIAKLNGISVPVLWWIHEARASYFPTAVAAMPETLEPNIHVYCAGAYAQRMLQEYRPNYTSKILLYYVEDFAKTQRSHQYQLKGAEGKTVFAIVGMQEHRKGQDIFIKAIRMLPPERRRECLFVFIGRECYPPIMEEIRSLVQDYPENAQYIPQLGKQELHDVYRQIDCLVCASRDDPMPIVVTEALVLSKIVICSENTGFGRLLEETGGGLLYGQDDPEKLMDCLMYVLEHQGNMQQMQQLARETYERYFSYEQFVNNVADVVYALKRTNHSISEFCSHFTTKKYGGEQKIFLKDELCEFDQNGKRSILLISHEFSLTGAPGVLKDLAQVLRKQGNNVAVLSPFDGPMREEFVKDGFPVILFEAVYEEEVQIEFLQFAKCFQLIIPNTVVTFRIIPFLGTINVPVLWWIHDSRESYNEEGFGNILPNEIPANVQILCGGSYARAQLLHYYPQYQAGELLYGIADFAQKKADAKMQIPVKKPGKLLFVCVGTLENRKGQDILVQAIRLLPEEDRKKCQFLFLGKVLQKKIGQCVLGLAEEMPDTVSYIPQVSPDTLYWIDMQADCLICCSRDDPMPVVVTQMQALSKIVICSENTGSASLIREEGGGVLFEKNSPEELAEKIRYVMNLNEAEKQKICGNARKIYDQYFCQDVFEESVRRNIEQLFRREHQIAHTEVSVVIPCYNAGAQGEVLLQKLRSQKAIGKLEIVCVDSGSTDGTQDLCRRYGCKLIQITQQEFSHSYARELGAKNAAGSILIFMTQDALPDGENWIAKMVEPIVARQAVAVSCRENSPESTDMFYRILSWNNIFWLGIQKEDRIGQYRPGMSPEELRINASLNDVACAIEREVFLRFGYRFGYAEDLDLGIRLLKSGYSIKKLHDPTVIHGHSRSAWYYLKRGFVEGRSLQLILNNHRKPVSLEALVKSVLPGYIAVHNCLALISNAKISSLEDFSKNFPIILKDQMEAKRRQMLDGWNEENEIQEFLNILTFDVKPVKMDDMSLAHEALRYFNTIVLPCMRENNWVVPDMAQTLCSCIYKQIALVVGSIVADLDTGEKIYSTIQEYTKGV